MKQLLTVEGRLAGMNEILGSANRHWAAGYRLKKSNMSRVCGACIACRIKPIPRDIKPCITIKCYEPNARRDEDNVKAGAAKIILDALQEQGILAGDGRKYITLVQPCVEVDRQSPRIEVTIETEVEE